MGTGVSKEHAIFCLESWSCFRIVSCTNPAN